MVYDSAGATSDVITKSTLRYNPLESLNQQVHGSIPWRLTKFI